MLKYYDVVENQSDIPNIYVHFSSCYDDYILVDTTKYCSNITKVENVL